jgi:hypothetical protein
MRFAVCCLLFFAAQSDAAHAACPTGADAAAGIRVTYEGFYSVYTRNAEGRVIETEYSEGGPFEYTSENGLIETAYRALGETDKTYDYDFDTSNLAPPEPWSAYSGVQTLTESTGESFPVPYSLHTRGVRPIRIGDCAYNAIGVQTYYYNDDGRTMYAFDYILELGLPVSVGYGEASGFEKFQMLGIEAEKQ